MDHGALSCMLSGFCKWCNGPYGALKACSTGSSEIPTGLTGTIAGTVAKEGAYRSLVYLWPEDNTPMGVIQTSIDPSHPKLPVTWVCQYVFSSS